MGFLYIIYSERPIYLYLAKDQKIESWPNENNLKGLYFKVCNILRIQGVKLRGESRRE